MTDFVLKRRHSGASLSDVEVALRSYRVGWMGQSQAQAAAEVP